MATPGTLRVVASLAGGAVCLCVWGVTWHEYQLRMHEIRQDVMLLACMSFFWAILYYTANTWRNMSTQEPPFTSGLPEILPQLPITEKKPSGDHIVHKEGLSEDQVVSTEKYHGMCNTSWTMEEVDSSESYHNMYNPNWTMEDNDDLAVLSPGGEKSVYLCSSFLCHLLLVLLNILHMERLLRYLFFLYREEDTLSTHPTLTQNLILFSPLCVIVVNVSMSVVFLLQLLLSASLRSPTREMHGSQMFIYS